jgi:hypothetical protein
MAPDNAVSHTVIMAHPHHNLGLPTMIMAPIGHDSLNDPAAAAAAVAAADADRQPHRPTLDARPPTPVPKREKVVARPSASPATRTGRATKSQTTPRASRLRGGPPG